MVEFLPSLLHACSAHKIENSCFAFLISHPTYIRTSSSRLRIYRTSTTRSKLSESRTIHNRQQWNGHSLPATDRLLKHTRTGTYEYVHTIIDQRTIIINIMNTPRSVDDLPTRVADLSWCGAWRHVPGSSGLSLIVTLKIGV